MKLIQSIKTSKVLIYNTGPSSVAFSASNAQVPEPISRSLQFFLFTEKLGLKPRRFGTAFYLALFWHFIYS
ncbi:MAG: hypothetical protein KGQ16_02320 [Cyanobacteria bacterium REEB444]|nr:hypothetical protein [Cyanobacteria bacterium REEB444]